MNRGMIAAIMLPLLLGSCGYVKAQEQSSDNTPVKAQETVYKKTLPGKQKLIVLREEVPYVPPSQEEREAMEKKRAEIRKQFPNFQFVDAKPDRVSQYSMFLNSAEGKSRSLLWQRTIPEYVKPFWGKAPDRIFFDVSLQSHMLVVLHAFGSGALIGEVVKLGESKGSKAIKPEWVMPISIRISMARGVPFVESATIEGSLNKSDLTVVAKKIDGDISRFLWKNDKWEEQKAPAPLTQPAAK